MSRNGYHNMMFIEILGGVKSEPSVIVKNERTEEENAVEIGIDDVFSSSDEENVGIMQNQDEGISEDVAHQTENVPESSDNRNLNISKVSDTKDGGDKNGCENFNVTNNIQTSESFVLNYGQNSETITTQKSKPKRTHWAALYRISSMTDCTKDRKKVIVTTRGRPQPVAYHDYTFLTNGKYICNHCQREYDSYLSVRKHIWCYHKNLKVYQCPYCPFKANWDLQSHIISRHTDESDIQWLKCNLCNMKFKLKNTLRRHMYSHFTKEQMEEFLKKCSICGKGFRTTDTLKDHIRYVHNKEKKKKIKCKDCHYTSFPYKMLRHVEEHHTDSHQLQIYNCDKCDYTTRYKHRLSVHIRKHKTEFFCEKCAYAASSPAVLKLHQMTHEKKIDEKELKYRCDKCDYKTYRQYSFSVHKLNHLKPEEIQYFYCYHCQFKAKRKDNLKTHVLKHFKKDEVTLYCYMCEFSTKQRKSLMDHIKEHKK